MKVKKGSTWVIKGSPHIFSNPVSGLRFMELVGLTDAAFKESLFRERTIPIDSVVIDKLKEFIEMNKEENKVGLSKNEEDGLIFKSVGKLKVVSNNAANKQLYRIIKYLSIKHGLRHTHASILLHAASTYNLFRSVLTMVHPNISEVLLTWFA